MGEVIDPVGQAQKIALDTSVFIYYFEDHPDFVSACRSLITSVYQGQADAVMSMIGVLELVTGPLRQKDVETADLYETRVTQFPNLEIGQVTLRVVRKAAAIRAEYRFPLPDAVHLATAIEHGADTFITNDRRLQQFRELPITLLSDFVH